MNTKTKTETLKNYADKLSKAFNIPFKKTVHGKNKTELLKYINDVESKYGKIEFNVEEIVNSKEELLHQAKMLPNFKKSYEKKSKEFLFDFINNQSKVPIESKDDEASISPVHFDDYIKSPDLNLKEAILTCFSEKPLDELAFQKLCQKLH
jgi:hypothetical protein